VKAPLLARESHETGDFQDSQETFMKLSRRSALAGTAALTLPQAGWSQGTGAQEKVVRYGISMADIPLTTGQPDRGAGAYQYTGLTIYDPLIAWELDVTERPGKMIPASPPSGR